MKRCTGSDKKWCPNCIGRSRFCPHKGLHNCNERNLVCMDKKNKEHNVFCKKVK